MKEVTVTFKTYAFHELKKVAKGKAINLEIEFILQTYLWNDDDSDPDVRRAILMAERMGTPWFAGSYIWEYAGAYVTEQCKQYRYLEDGSIFTQWQKGEK